MPNIRMTDGEMMIHSHAGSRPTNKLGNLHGYPNHTWYNLEGIANILLLANVKKLFRVTFNSDRGNVFVVHTSEKEIEFRQSQEGLYSHDVRTNGSVFVTIKSEKAHTQYTKRKDVKSNVITVRENKKFYTKRDIKRAKEVRKFQRVIQSPMSRHLKMILQSNSIRDCPILPRDIDIVDGAFGLDIAAMKGRTM